MNYPPDLQFNGIHLGITIAALALGFFIGTIYGYMRGCECGHGRWRR